MYVGSYAWRLRQQAGHALLLMPGAVVVVEDSAARILLTKRTDNGAWCLPGGGAEEGGSFARTAIDELQQETGLDVEEEDLVAFACLSEAALATKEYPNGDVAHYFSLCFTVHRWQGEPSVNDDESSDVAFFPPDALPHPMTRTSATALQQYQQFKRSRTFQVR